MNDTNNKGKGLKLMIKLHQPKKWEKPKYVSDREYDYVESLIYNDQNNRFKEYMQARDMAISATWIDQYLMEDEVYEPCSLDQNYFITTYGRVFSGKRAKQMVIVNIGSKLSVVLATQTLDLAKEFAQQGWIFSKSFVLGKYEQYGWKYSTNYKLK